MNNELSLVLIVCLGIFFGSILGFAICDFDRSKTINQQKQFCFELCAKNNQNTSKVLEYLLECRKKAGEI